MADSHEQAITAGPPTRFWRRFALLFAAGFAGVLALLPLLLPTMRAQLAAPGAPPLPLIVALAIVQSSVLLGIAIAVGIRFAPRVRLRSHIDDRARAGGPLYPGWRREVPLALALGVAAGVLIVVLDAVSRRWVNLEVLAAAGAVQPQLGRLVAGMLYGGVTEELLIRWGLMSLLVWIAWRLSRRDAPPGPGAYWFGILLSALIFGAGHLPAVAAMAELTTPMVIQTLLLNGIGGVVFGWLFWRRSLEAAMVAHATGHVIFAIAGFVGPLLG